MAGECDSQAVTNETNEEDEVLITLTPELVAAHAAATTALLSKNELAIPGEWLDLPDWLSADDLPFDATAYYPVADDDNGASYYLRAIARSRFDDALIFLPELESQLENDEPNEVKAAINDSRLIGKARYRLLDWVYDSETDLDWKLFREKASVFVAHSKSAVEDLRKAQQCKNTFIPVNFALDELGPSQSYRTLSEDLLILGIASADLHVAMDAIDMTLRMEQDFRKIGSETTQLVCSSIVRHALSYQVKRVLKRCNDSKQIQRVIDLLELAHRSEVQSPRLIEMARFEHLQLRKLLKELQSGTFRADPETLEYLSIPDDMPSILIAHQLLTLDVMGGYLVNDVVSIESIEKSFGQDSDVATKTREAIAESKKSPIARSAAASIILPKVMATFEEMGDRDFEFEIKILKQRYGEIEKALTLRYPARIDALQVLRRQWVGSDEWKKTKLLKWYLPRRFTGKLSPRLRQLIDGTLSLACVKKYQLEHDGLLPKDVTAAIQYAGVDDPAQVIDPYSGRPFKLISDSDRVGVYSFGPDRQDNQGQPELSPSSFNSDDEGDVVFWLERT